MSHIPEKKTGPVLDFALELAKDSENFPKKLLSLLDRYFGYSRSIFFPSNYTNFLGAYAQRVSVLNNYITYGIRYGSMYNYKERIYKDDIYRYSALPPELRGRRVLFTEDIVSMEEYEDTAFGKLMIADDMYYQAVLYFFHGGRVIGSVGLFRSREEGSFRGEGRAMLEYIAELAEASYLTYLRHSGENRFHDNFSLFFRNSSVGAVILNQEMTVMQCNRAAREISRVFWEQNRHGQVQFLRGNYQGEEQFREVQTMINEVSEHITEQDGSRQSTISLAGDITFFHTVFLSSSSAGPIRTWHLLLITAQERRTPQDRDHPYHTLTQQERRIVHLLASGMKNEQIAEELHISIYTVRTHIANIYKKFEVNSKVDLLMRMQPILMDNTPQQ